MATSPLGTCFFRFGGKGWKKQVPLGLVFSVFWGEEGCKKQVPWNLFFLPQLEFIQYFRAFPQIVDCRASFFSATLTTSRRFLQHLRRNRRPTENIRNCGWACSEQQSSACMTSLMTGSSPASADGHALDWISSATAVDGSPASTFYFSLFGERPLLFGAPHSWYSKPVGNEFPCGFGPYTSNLS